MWLLIDDKRDLNCEIIARTPEAAKGILKSKQFEFFCICFDHDLGCEESGYDILKFALVNGYATDYIQLVTSNPVGRQNMKNLLTDYGYKSKDGINFFK